MINEDRFLIFVGDRLAELGLAAYRIRALCDGLRVAVGNVITISPVSGIVIVIHLADLRKEFDQKRKEVVR